MEPALPLVSPQLRNRWCKMLRKRLFMLRLQLLPTPRNAENAMSVTLCHHHDADANKCDMFYQPTCEEI